MFIIGDVLAIIGIFVSLSLCGYAILLGVNLFLDDRVGIARQRLDDSAWRVGLVGLITAGVLGGVGIALFASPPPIFKIIGFGLLCGLLIVSAVGGGALTRLGAERIQRQFPAMPSFTAQSRAAAILVGAGMMPFIGWLLFLPVMLAMALGAGTYAFVRSGARVRAEVIP